MKYMGSKRAMLQNGLGETLCNEAKNATRFVDLFSGSGVVGWFLAQKTNLPVYSYDLQLYSVFLSKAIIERNKPVESNNLLSRWLDKVKEECIKVEEWYSAEELDENECDITRWVKKARRLCNNSNYDIGPIYCSYGGYYFSPKQSILFDVMRKTLPKNTIERNICLAATIISASKCVASPGHTAQPFQPTKSAEKFIKEAWLRDPLVYAENALKMLCPIYANTKGKSNVGEAVSISEKIEENDLVFIDPPYSGVHYSRFYHVLETIARGKCSHVSGVGRYPPPEERPTSSFCRKGESRTVLEKLINNLSNKGCKVIFTFPKNECSNGLSGDIIIDVASEKFKVTKKCVNTRFSTLGGNNGNRSARQVSEELILTLKPK